MRVLCVALTELICDAQSVGQLCLSPMHLIVPNTFDSEPKSDALGEIATKKSVGFVIKARPIDSRCGGRPETAAQDFRDRRGQD